MPTYAYTVKTHDGQVIQNVVQAASRQEALTAIQAQAPGVVIRVEERRALEFAARPPPLPGAAPAALRRGRGGRVRQAELAIFFRQMAISVNAGVPLRESLESVAEDLEHAAFRRILQRVAQGLHEGRSFSEALAAEPATFPALCVALVRTAEEAGSMGKTLEQMAASLEKSEALARKIRSITAYPIFVSVFFVLVLTVMTLFILPKFQDVFGGHDAALPLLTRVVFNTNRFIVRHIVWVALALGGLVAGGVVYVRTPAGRMALDRFLLRLPWFGVAVRKVALARFCKNLAVMIRGGVPIASAMEITAAVAGNKVIEAAIHRSRERVLYGSDIAGSLGREDVFPRLLVRMVGIGEASGRLPEVMDRVADGYESEVEGAVMVATALFEPIVIAFFGMIVLVFVLAIYLPVFTMATHMQ
jgi:type IV pilus assembly protein PilC